MDFIKKPMEIENRSMEIIAPYLEGLHLNEEETKVYSRIIHAAGDVEYAPIIRLHPDSTASLTSSPTPKVVAADGSLMPLSVSAKPEAAAISIIAVSPVMP